MVNVGAVFVARRLDKASWAGTRADEKKANGGRRHSPPPLPIGVMRLKSAVAGQFNYNRSLTAVDPFDAFLFSVTALSVFSILSTLNSPDLILNVNDFGCFESIQSNARPWLWRTCVIWDLRNHTPALVSLGPNRQLCWMAAIQRGLCFFRVRHGNAWMAFPKVRLANDCRLSQVVGLHLRWLLAWQFQLKCLVLFWQKKRKGNLEKRLGQSLAGLFRRLVPPSFFLYLARMKAWKRSVLVSDRKRAASASVWWYFLL